MKQILQLSGLRIYNDDNLSFHPLQAKLHIFFSLYQISPTKTHDIENILSDPEP